jgi:hypothetical protein
MASGQQIIDALRALPSQVQELVEGLSEDALCWRPSPGEWSIKEVCCHLRDDAEIHGERIRRMLSEEEPFLASYDQEAMASERAYQNESMPLVLTALRAFSGGLAYLLENLGEGEWQRTGRHEERGPISIAQYAQLLADHARQHLEQIRALRGQLAPGR